MEKVLYLLFAICILVIIIALTVTFAKKSKFLFWIPFFFTFIPIEYVDRYIVGLPSILTWLQQLILIFCFGISLIVFLRRPLKVNSLFIYAFCIFLIVAIVSVSINGTRFSTAVYSQRGFIFIFAYLVNFKAVYDRLSLTDLYRITIKAGLVSVILAVFQRIYVTLGSSTGDMVAGLFSSDSQYLYFQCFCFIISISYWYHHKQLINKISPKNLSIIYILSIGIANNKAGIGFLLVILLFFAIFIGYKNFWKFFGKLIVLGIVIGFSLMIFENIIRGSGRLKDKSSYAYLSDPDYIIGYLFGTDAKNSGILEKNGALRRGSALTFGYNLLKENSYTFYFGKGPGSTSESSIGTGDLSNQFEGYKIGRSSLSEKLTEVGIIGTIFFIITIIALYFNNSREYPLYKEQILIRKISVLFIILYLPYENMFLTILNGLIFSILLYPNIINNKEEEVEEIKILSTVN